MTEITPRGFCGVVLSGSCAKGGGDHLCAKGDMQCYACRRLDREAFLEDMLTVVREHVHCDRDGSCDWNEDMLCVLREWGVEPREGEYRR